MTARKLFQHALTLSNNERIILVQQIWDSISDDAVEDKFELTPEQRRELNRRLRRLETHPHEGEPWEVVRERIIRKLQRRSSSVAKRSATRSKSPRGTKSAKRASV